MISDERKGNKVIVFRESPDPRLLADRVADLRSQLAEIGCSSELGHVPGLVAVDTDSVSINKALGVLKAGEKADLWEYEEAALRI